MILFIASSETDYLQDLTYAGLAETLGKAKIQVFPSHWTYDKERKNIFSSRLEYPRNLGLVPGAGTAKAAWKEVAARLDKNEYRVVILAAAKKDALDCFARVADKVRVPWIFVDGGDRSDVGGDFLRVSGKSSLKIFQEICGKLPPALIFKREVPLGFRDDSVLPFPFSFKESNIPGAGGAGAGKYDVLFWAVESSETRKQAFRLLRGRYDCEANGSVPGRKFRKYSFRGKDYFRELHSAKTALSFRGEGFDTLRYWEVPACGTFLVSEIPAIQIPDNFRDGEHALFCKNDLSDLISKIDYALSHEKERQEMARAAQTHLLRHHTHLRRAQFFIEKVREKLGIDLAQDLRDAHQRN